MLFSVVNIKILPKMSYNMHLQGRHHNTTESEHSKTKSKGEKACSSSDYSTCSDNPQSNMYSNKKMSQGSRESIILAGHIVLDQTDSNSVLEDTNFSISPFEKDTDKPDLDLAILCSESSDDVYSDCRDFNYSTSSNDSTMYMHLGQVYMSKASQTNLSNNNSRSKGNAAESEDFAPAIGMLHQRLITIVEETEITNTTDYIVKDLSPSNSYQNTGQIITEMINKVETHKEQNNNFIRKVLFADVDNVVDNQNNRLESRNIPKSLDSRPGLPTPSKLKDNCHHNNTESFVLWEKFCEASEKLASRRSFSFTELNADIESCSGDDEYSTSCKTVDDIQLSRTSVEKENYSAPYQHKGMYRSKSCESILREVKHLPHVLYDRFLKCLSEEIEKIRKENVMCTCQQIHRNNSNKENQRKRSAKKSPIKLTNRIINIESGTTESRLPLRIGNYTGTVNKTRSSPKITNSTHLLSAATNGIRSSPKTAISLKLSPEAANRTRLSPEVRNQTRLSPDTGYRTKLSPEARPRNLSQFQTSPKSPMKTPTTPSKTYYFWNKQIVSPVGEYIRGKRQSPFQSSPSKKK